MNKEKNKSWQHKAPDSEGFWWLYGEANFGTMGGNYTGVFPPEFRLKVVEIIRIGQGKHSSLQGICEGQFINLRPFNRNEQEAGYVGVWKRVEIPELPTTEFSQSDFEKMWR